jgi:hypothetical protein
MKKATEWKQEIGKGMQKTFNEHQKQKNYKHFGRSKNVNHRLWTTSSSVHALIPLVPNSTGQAAVDK